MSKNKITPEMQENILAICTYEDSVNMPENERWTYVDYNRHIHLKLGDSFVASTFVTAQADKCREYLRFGDEVDLATSGRMEQHEMLKICDTPPILLKTGFAQNPMLYTQGHLMESIQPKDWEHPHRHGLTISQIKRLPQLLEQPVLLADNPSRADTMLAVLCAVDNDRLPLITSILPNGRGYYEMTTIETNMILTVFGKDHFESYFANVLTPDKIIFIDKEKGQALERLSKRQLLRNYSSLDLDVIIRRPQCLVKEKIVGNLASGIGKPNEPVEPSRDDDDGDIEH